MILGNVGKDAPSDTASHPSRLSQERSRHNFLYWPDSPNEPRSHHCWGSANTLSHIKIGRTPLDEWSVRLRDHYLTTQMTHKAETSILPVGFEPEIPASERPWTPRPLESLSRQSSQHYFITPSCGQWQRRQLRGCLEELAATEFNNIFQDRERRQGVTVLRRCREWPLSPSSGCSW